MSQLGYVTGCLERKYFSVLSYLAEPSVVISVSYRFGSVVSHHVSIDASPVMEAR